jgi:hydrogenase 3 maturation protease
MQIALKRLRTTNDPHCNVAILGVGQRLNGDDAAGIAVANALHPLVAVDPRALVIDAGPAPENCTGTLRKFQPALVIIVDAAQMDLQPGEVRWLDWRDTHGLSASTHTLPLHMLAKFLTLDLGCEVALIGIQPAYNTVDAPLSEPVQQTVTEIVRDLSAALR